MKKRFLMLFMMLLLSALVVTAAGYAWFTASAQSQVTGTQIKAETQGVLKVWTENTGPEGGTTIPKLYQNFTTLINFNDPDNNFYNPAYNEHVMKDQTGNGSTFMEAQSTGVSDNYANIPGLGVALSYNLYFSAYTGNPAPSLRDIFLSTMQVTDVGDGTLADSVRVAFLDSSGNIYGIYANVGAQPNFATRPQAGSPVSTSPGALKGSIVAPTTFDATPDAYDPTTYTGTGSDEQVIRRIQAGENGTSICQIDASVAVPDNATVKVVIWIEGTDPNTTDARLSESVAINMIFQARTAGDAYSINYNANGGSWSGSPKVLYSLSEEAIAQGVDIEEVEKFVLADIGTTATLARPGYTFGGFTYNVAGTPTTLEEPYELLIAHFAANKTITLTAVWNAIPED